jgi:hypothetical protein
MPIFASQYAPVAPTTRFDAASPASGQRGSGPGLGSSDRRPMTVGRALQKGLYAEQFDGSLVEERRFLHRGSRQAAQLVVSDLTSTQRLPKTKTIGTGTKSWSPEARDVATRIAGESESRNCRVPSQKGKKSCVS